MTESLKIILDGVMTLLAALLIGLAVYAFVITAKDKKRDDELKKVGLRIERRRDPLPFFYLILSVFIGGLALLNVSEPQSLLLLIGVAVGCCTARFLWGGEKFVHH